MARKMKDSGVEWIGKIPEEWKIVKVKDAFIRKNIKANIKNPIILTLARSGVKIRDITNNEGQLAADYSNYNPVEIDDLLLNPMDLISGDNCNISRVKGVISPAYINLRYRKGTNPELYNLYFKNLYWGNVLFAHGKGVSYENRWTLSYETLSQMKIPYPPSYEQDKIAEFIVDKLNKIEDIKSTIIQEIQTIEDYKKSLITEAVTKGLDKNVEMKDSGVEWIGKIPKHWKVIRIKNTALLKARIGWQGLRSDEFLDDERLPYLVTGTDFKEGFVDWKNCVRISEQRFEMDKNIQIKENDLLITKDGTIGKLAIAKNCPDKASLNSGVFVIRNQGPYKYSDKYMYYLLQSEQFLLWFELNDAGNSTIRHLYQKDFYNFSFTYPEEQEQEKIALYLDKKTKSM